MVSTSKLQSVVVTAADPAAAASHRPIGVGATADPAASAAAAASHKQPWWLLSGLLVLQRTGDQRRRDACEVLRGMAPTGCRPWEPGSHGATEPTSPGATEPRIHDMRLRFRIQCSSAVSVNRASHQNQRVARLILA